MLDAPTIGAHQGVTQELLELARAEAGRDDAENRFFETTHRALVAAGHYVSTVPAPLGGGGLDLPAAAWQQRQLARYAPAAALASSMHLYWTGSAADLSAAGLPGLEFIADVALDGGIIASGHAEAGNDVPIVLSTSTAEPVDGGYRVTGRKHFGSLGPVWDLMGFHALDVSVPDRPVVIHGFVRREDDGVTVVEDWDTMAMRASQSFDTVLDGVFVPSDRVVAAVPAGSPESPVTGAMSVWALTLISNVYVGVAERALELAVGAAGQRTSIALGGRAMSANPMVQHRVAEMWIALDGARSGLDAVADDWAAGIDHGPMWGPKVFAAKERTAQAVRFVLDTAADVVGGSSLRSDSELSRLWRDSRAVSFHPADHAFAHEAIGKAVLGVDSAGPRW
jgi:alkylation response protein AidB-like acyl-CoA dehydrogenase